VFKLGEKRSKRTEVIFATTALIVALSALIAAAFFLNQTSTAQGSDGYWILDISSSTGGYVIPNGPVHVPMNQTGINVTAVPEGNNGFMWWRLDREIVQNQSSTIFLPRQEANSNHTLEAVFVIGTPTITPNAEAVTFTCYYNSTTDIDPKFTFPIEVNLADGLSSHEAISIAYKVADCIGKTRHQLNSTIPSDDGSWTVNLHWGLTEEDMGHTFQAKIYPSNQTIYYSHCR
jgi:hypothetical protein